jgi:hypothetical protein
MSGSTPAPYGPARGHLDRVSPGRLSTTSQVVAYPATGRRREATVVTEAAGGGDALDSDAAGNRAEPGDRG